MKAAYITQTGPPEVIQYGDVPVPEATGSRVLVRVKAVAVNPIDTYIRSGMVPMDLPKPFIVGCDLAGVVEAVGPDVIRYEPGDRVWGTNQGLMGRQGTFAELACVDECWLYPTPPRVKDEEAAAVAMVGITAHLGLVRDAKLQPGELLLVNGASGGVGSTVVQLGRVLGARVIATVRGRDRVDAILKLGADHAIDSTAVPVESALRKIAPAGVNVWWETSREPDFDRVVAALAPRGRMVLMAGREARPPFPVGPFYVKGCALHGFVMFMAHPDEQRDSADDLNAWLSAGRLRPRIDRILSLSETAVAHRLQEENTIGKSGVLAGKIVLRA
ncbi:MAG TPA: NADPH:quinone reductase [Verrucomicrobiota bacterium]|nr:NADPH:quinone reductase [Verrucomicrobiota bacterium]HNU49729.1 NADPH:quinone reductase [Verrucomicrobiota bacterium]